MPSSFHYCAGQDFFFSAGIELRTLCILGKQSISELHLSPK